MDRGPPLTRQDEALRQSRGELTGVYVVTAKGESAKGFALRAVRTGATHGDGVEVLAGLKSGDQVALDPVRAGLSGAQPAAK